MKNLINNRTQFEIDYQKGSILERKAICECSLNKNLLCLVSSEEVIIALNKFHNFKFDTSFTTSSLTKLKAKYASLFKNEDKRHKNSHS